MRTESLVYTPKRDDKHPDLILESLLGKRQESPCSLLMAVKVTVQPERFLYGSLVIKRESTISVLQGKFHGLVHVQTIVCLCVKYVCYFNYYCTGVDQLR